MKRNLAHKIQLSPTKDQNIALNRACGTARFTYNWALATWKEWYDSGQKPTSNKLKKYFNSIKKEQFPWIYESPKDANQQPFANLGMAFTKFFQKKAKYPKFKKKWKRNTLYISNHLIKIIANKIRLPVIGWVKSTEPLRFNGKIMSATVSRHANKWFVSVNVEMENYTKTRISDNEIAIDFGLKTLITDQNGNQIHSSKPFTKEQKKLARYQRQYSRKKCGSNNKKKARFKIAKLHKRISDIRNDFNHKLTTNLVRENQSVIIEDLSLVGWHKLFGKSSADIAIGEIIRQLHYKAKMYGTNIIVIDKWAPTSKACSSCGGYKKDLKMSDRMYECEHCGLSLDRDHNAAINIFKSGKMILDRAGLAQIDAFGH